jgi:hypothetical protein
VNFSKKEKISMVPLERELANAHRRREVLDELLEISRAVELVQRSGLGGGEFTAWEKFRRAVLAAIGIIKKFSP